jgi:A/G-specific adenine glycosylase
MCSQKTNLHKTKHENSSHFASYLLDWYDENRRDLPWRAKPGASAAPYQVWLSEIMLQQTTVATVGPYFTRFLHLWPRIRDLANADLDEVLNAWQGLGYYARARNLHRCARLIADEYQGTFPGNEEDLLKLPGVGSYTAAAIAAIAFDKRAVVVDGNIERVISRTFNLHDPLPKSKPRIKELTDTVTPDERSGDFAQAMMDIGATVCTPRNPKCMICPLTDLCDGRKAGTANDLPKKEPKKPKPTRYCYAWWIENDLGEILLRKRDEKGMLGGMIEIPTSEWLEQAQDLETCLSVAGLGEELKKKLVSDEAKHTFTHFHFEMKVVKFQLNSSQTATFNSDLTKKWGEAFWCLPNRLTDYALPTTMKKIVKHALK